MEQYTNEDKFWILRRYKHGFLQFSLLGHQNKGARETIFLPTTDNKGVL